MSRFPFRIACWGLALTVSVVAEKNIDIKAEARALYPMSHGAYSRAWQGDWSKLPTGRELARKDLKNIPFVTVDGPAVREVHSNLEQCFLTNRAVKVRWPGPAEKYASTLYYIRNCKAVLVDQLYVQQLGPSNTGSHGVFIEDCDTVVVRNAYFSGPLSQVHLRIENCREVFIDGVEIAGLWDGEHRGFRNGIGIFVEGGQMDGEGKRFRLYSDLARDLEWLLIQNCYIHDYSYGDRWENKDGIQIHSAPNGLLFNNVVENWLMAYADGAFDISHRRTDLHNRVFRIERNIITNCSLTKSPGRSGADNALFWVNNIFYDAFHGDYHQTWSNVFRFNTWTYAQASNNVHFKLWGFEGPTVVADSLIASRFPIHLIYQNNEREIEKFRAYFPDRNVYAVPSGRPWLVGARKENMDLPEWKAKGKDGASLVLDESALGRLVAQDALSPLPDKSPAASFADGFSVNHPDVRFRVARDFLGKARPPKPAAGAFEPAAKP